MEDELMNHQEYLAVNVIENRPIQGISNDFSGVLTFEINLAKDECLLSNSLYMSARIDLESISYTGNQIAAPTNVLKKPIGLYGVDANRKNVLACVSSGGLMNLFSKMTHELISLNGSSTIQNLENLPQAVGLINQSFSSPINSSKSGSEVFNIVEEKSYIRRGLDINSYVEADTIRETPLSFVLRNAKKQGLHNKEISLSSRIPSAFFQSEAKVYQSQHTLRFTIDNDFRRKFLDVVVATGRALDSNLDSGLVDCERYTGTFVNAYGDGQPTANSVACKINDIFLYYEVVKINADSRPMGKSMLIIENFNVTQKALASARENFLLPCAKNILKIILGLQTPRINITTDITDAKTDAILTPSGMLGFNETSLSTVSIKYLNDIFPQRLYSLKLQKMFHSEVGDSYSHVSSTLLGDSSNNSRAFEDFCNACEFDDSLESMTYNQWSNQPVFVFKFASSTNISSNIEITLESETGSKNALQLDDGVVEDRVVTDIAGSTLYCLYAYRTLIEIDAGVDSVEYKVTNLA